MTDCTLPDFPALTNTNDMFRNCTALEGRIYLSGGGHEVTCDNMFNGCTNIEEIEMDGIQVSSASHMFDGCINLSYVQISNMTSSTERNVIFALSSAFPNKTFTRDEDRINIH
jgi:hypothetical protein